MVRGDLGLGRVAVGFEPTPERGRTSRVRPPPQGSCFKSGGLRWATEFFGYLQELDKLWGG